MSEEINPITVKMLTCRPVDMSEMMSHLDGMEEPPIYPGSIRLPCLSCTTEVYVGPKQQELLESEEPGGYYLVICFACAAGMMAAEGVDPDEVEITDLGNDFARDDS